MIRVAACSALLWLAGCGLDGPPIRPEAPDPAPQTGVVIGGSGYIGGTVNR